MFMTLPTTPPDSTAPAGTPPDSNATVNTNPTNGSTPTIQASGSTYRVGSFLPSVNGFRFVNHFAPAPIPFKTPFGTIALGNAAGGMCGGMVFAVRDYYEGEEPVPTITVAPVKENDLFIYIGGRLWDSFGGVKALRYYQWMQMGNASIGKLVWERELPRIKQGIIGGRLSCLGLVLAEGANPGALGLNHQVLCYGYDDTDDNTVTLHVYDPNTAPVSGDAVFITIQRSGDVYHFTHNLHTHSQNLRGLFDNTAYHWQKPPEAKA